MEEKKKIDRAALLQKWKSKKAEGVKQPIKEEVPKLEKPTLSKGQQRLYAMQMMDTENPFYQYSHLYKFHGKIDVEILRQALQYVINNHDSLRYKISDSSAGPELSIFDRVEADFSEIDYSTKTEKESTARKEVYRFAREPFDMSSDVLIRARLIKMAEAEYWLVLSIHHIIGDRWSLEVIQNELYNTYAKLQAGNKLESTLSATSYQDYVAWEQGRKVKEIDLQYWKEKLQATEEVLELPHIQPRPKELTYKGRQISKRLSKAASEALIDYSNKKGTTLYNTLLACLKVLLYRLSGQEHISVGTPASTRDKVEFEIVVGFFTETMILQTTLSPEFTFDSLVDEVKRTAIEAFDHKNVPFDKLVKTLGIERAANVNPLFQVMYIHELKIDEVERSLPFSVQDEPVDLGVSKFDATLFTREVEGEIELTLEYSTDVLNDELGEGLLQQLEAVMSSVASDTKQKIAEVKILPGQEYEKIIEDSAGTTDFTLGYKNVIEAIDEMAVKSPTAVAVRGSVSEITYEELVSRAEQLGHLISEKQTDTSSPIGIYLGREEDFVVGMIAVLKSGHPYVPLDPSYPQERLQYMAEHSQMQLVVSSVDIVSAMEKYAKPILIDEIKSDTPKLVNKEILIDSLAYIIYTSGSTGKPKGVGVSHTNLAYSTYSRSVFYPEDPSCFLLMSPFSFDSSVAGIYWTLTTGGTLLISPTRIEQDINALTTLIAENKVSHSLMLPSLYEVILKFSDHQKLNSLRNIMVAGEACPLPLIKLHSTSLPQTKLYNEYGPTESTVWCIATELTVDNKYYVPIGKAIPGYEAYILDDSENILPAGVTGELYIGGPGVTPGYIHNEEATAEKFLDNKYGSSDTYYKTGDLAKRDTDGNILFLGRADHQVKIRGHRIELGEIDEAIKSLLSDVEVVTVVHKKQVADAEQDVLVSYIASENIDEDLKPKLEALLPAYMVPASFTAVAEFKKLPNGKCDLKNLPTPIFSVRKTENRPPENPTQQTIVDIWKRVIGLENIGIDDNYFSLGGDSIMSIRVVSAARDLGFSIEPTAIFEYQTVRKLAAHIVGSTSQVKETEIIKVESSKLSIMQEAFLFKSELDTNDDGKLLLEFFLSGNINIEELNHAWGKTIQRHEVLRTYISKGEGRSYIQKVAPESKSTIKLVDLTQGNETLESVKSEIQSLKMNLYGPESNHLILAKTADKKYTLLWSCHHLFVDGWSCGIIIEDLLKYYAKKDDELNPIFNYPSYLTWKSNNDDRLREKYWKSTLYNIDTIVQFPTEVNEKSTVDKVEILGEKLSEDISNYGRKHSMPSSLIYEGAWAIMLSKLWNKEEVLYGLTVSGRNSGFPNITESTGLFMNVIPQKAYVDGNKEFSKWLYTYQKQINKRVRHEDSELGDIQKWTDWPIHLPLFESLFVYGNFMRDELSIGELTIDHFEGGFTAAYPLSIRVNPTKETELTFRYQSEKVSGELASWISTTYKNILSSIVKDDKSAIDNIPSYTVSLSVINVVRKTQKLASETGTDHSYEQIKKVYREIWIDILGIDNIATTDSFFDLGGSSLQAVTLVSQLEERLGYSYPPSVLLDRPTYGSLFDYLTSIREDAESPVVVKMKDGKPGTTPLICFHAGGTQIFFYKHFTEHLPDEIPVYSIQAPRMHDVADFPKDMSELTAYYIDEIKKVQPKGPYHLLGTCFSNAVILEMSHQLKAKGEKVERLYIIDSGPNELDYLGLESPKKRIRHAVKNMIKSIFPTKIVYKIEELVGSKGPQERAEMESLYEDNTLRATINILNDMFVLYEWKQTDTDIYLVRSEQFANDADKRFQTENWRKLTTGSLDIDVVPGTHLTIFDMPYAKGVAEAVAEYFPKD